MTGDPVRLNMPVSIPFVNEIIGPTRNKFTDNVHVKVGAGIASGAFDRNL